MQRETLYQSFSEDGNPRPSALHRVLGKLGMRSSVTTLAKGAGAAAACSSLFPSLLVGEREDDVTSKPRRSRIEHHDPIDKTGPATKIVIPSEMGN